MANLKLPKYFLTNILLSFITFALFSPAICVNIQVDSVPDLLKQSALDSLNDNSPTGNTYKDGDLIRAEKLLEPPYKVYRLMLNLEPNCIDDSSCLREVCAIELRQHELGVIDVKPDSIQCMYLYPQSDQAETQQQQQQTSQDGGQNGTNALDQDTTESFGKSNKNSSFQLVHEVETMADGNERPFIAVRATDRNYCAGCPYELNPTLPGLAAYGEQVVQSMDDTGLSDFKHKVISIARVTRAVPPGSNVVLYELLLEIAETNCRRISISSRGNCSPLPNVPIKLCLVRFEQRPWQKDSQKIVRNNCTDLPDSYDAQTDRLDEPSVTGDASYASETTSGQGSQMASSYPSAIDDFLGNTEKTPSVNNQQNTRRPVVEETATKTIVETNNAKLDDDLGFQNKYKEFDEFLESIDFYKPIKQSVPPPTDDRTPVQEEIIRPKIVGKTTDSDGHPETSDNDDQHSVERTKRSLSNSLANEKEVVRRLAQKVVDELDEIDVDNKKRILLDIIDAKKQPGDDTIYYITMKVAESHCIEGTNACLDDAHENVKICKAQVGKNESDSLDTAKVFQSQCYDESSRLDGRYKRNLGGWEDKSSEDPEIKKMGDKVLHQFSKNYKGKNEPLLVTIEDAKAQVVAGMKYKMTVKIGESTCRKGEKGNHCQLKSERPLEEYFVTIWSQPWKDQGLPIITIVSSKDKKLDRARRSNERLGGIRPIDSQDPKIQQYVKEGLNKYSETFGRSYEPYLVEIVESTQQVVAGTSYKIRVRLGESTCPKGVQENCQLKENSQIEEYEVSVWSRPWLDKGQPDIQIKAYSDKKKKVSKRSLRGQYYNANMLKIAKNLEYERAFEKFIVEHDKAYKSEEEKNYRLEVFSANMKKIEALNDREQGTATYGATMFADLTSDEFRLRHLGLRPDLRSDNDIPLPMAEIPDIELPKQFDWRDKNVVTEVKDQGSCGSCWAFSVTGNVEALNAIKHGKLLSLSEQELVDCDKLDSGCNGGLPDTAYRALEQIGGLELENDYPYDGKDEKCHFDKKKARVQVISGLNITSNETKMAQWLVQNGPISIGINANAMQFYMGGISHPFKFLCNGDDLDHGVLIVGYGIHTYPIFKKSMPYWIIKNSWGPRWGEQGYYRVYRGDGTCGVNKMATSAVIA